MIFGEILSIKWETQIVFTQSAFAADGPSTVFIEVVLCTLRLLVIGGFVAAAEMRR